MFNNFLAEKKSASRQLAALRCAGRATSKELFYIAMDGRLMAVPIRFTADDVEHDTPVPLFPTRVGGAVQGGLSRQQYVVTSDGQRFLMSTIQEVSPSPIEVILNWKPQP